MRDAVSTAQNAATTAGNVGAVYGANASSVGSQLMPYLTRQLNNPSGMSQRDIGTQLTAALAGTGGEMAGLTGAANRYATTTRNPNGFSASLAEAARQRMKGDAAASESIASKNADIKLQQQQQAAQGLSGLYGMDTKAQLESMGQIAPDINAATNASKSGWLQNLEGIAGMVQNGAQGATGIKGLFK